MNTEYNDPLQTPVAIRLMVYRIQKANAVTATAQECHTVTVAAPKKIGLKTKKAITAIFQNGQWEFPNPKKLTGQTLHWQSNAKWKRGTTLVRFAGLEPNYQLTEAGFIRSEREGVAQ